MYTSIVSLLRRDTFSLKYIAEVDGVRFLAISMVFIHHAFNVFSTISRFEPVQRKLTDILIGNGFKGIHVFFVLSGFILAIPFIKWRNGTASRVVAGNYFLRRLIRLEPPFIIALLFCYALEYYYGTASGRFGHFTASLFYLHNIIFGRGGNVNSVAWTLEIETQFYILAPLIFQVFRLNKPLRRLLLTVLALAFSIAHYIYLPATLTLYNYISYFLLGALIADFYADGNIPFFNHWWAVVLAIVLYALVWYLPINANPAANFPFPFIIAAFIFCIFNNDVLRKVFSMKYLAMIGGMCYSIYLLHYPFLFIIGNISKHLYTGTSFWKNFLVQFPIYATGVLLISTIYYILVEKPFMSLSAKRKQRRQPTLSGVNT